MRDNSDARDGWEKDIIDSPRISCSTITKVYGDVLALDRLTVTVGKGEMFALVGPDGAGKTTLLRILAGVETPDEGTIEILGYQIPHQRRSVKGRLGYLAQGFTLYGDLSIDENISFFAEIYGLRDYRERREELLAFTRLEQFRTRLAGRLSGGMKKKLALTCALVHKPDILLLDEPTTGVDPVTRRDFWLLLGRLLETGITIVVATPYLDEAERCERVALLNNGAFLAVDTPKNLQNAIDGVFVEVVTRDPRSARRAIAKAEIDGIREMQTKGDRIHLRLSGSVSTTTVVNNLHIATNGEAEILEVTPTLENVYISMLQDGTP